LIHSRHSSASFSIAGVAWRVADQVKAQRRLPGGILMSDVSPGTGGTSGYPVDVPPTQTAGQYTSGGEYQGANGGDSAKDKAKVVAGQTKDAAVDVKDTAKEQAQRVGQEAKSQVRNIASDVRDQLGRQARTQNDRLSGTIRQTADQLDEMRGDRADGPAAAVVSRVADGGRQLADYLDRNGPEGVLREVQDFARRRPGAFLATALAAGFVVGRLGKSVAKADANAGEGKPSTDSFVSGQTGTAYGETGTAYGQTGTAYGQTGTAYGQTGAGYGQTGTGTGYAATPPTTEPYGTATTSEYAATGTGTPVVVEETYVAESPERSR
jgi:hypothetical protein